MASSLSPNAEEILLLNAALLPGEAGLNAWLTWRETFGGRNTTDPVTWLFPLLYQALIQKGIADSEIEDLRSFYRSTKARNQVLLGSAREITQEFQAAGIPHMLLK